MIKKYTQYECERDIFPIRVPGIAGEGLRMAWETGAAQSRINMQVIFSLPPPFQGRGGTREELAAFRQPNLIVNLLGQRFVDEETIVNTTYMGNAIHQQKNHCGFIIFDADTRQEYEKNGMYYPDCMPVGSLDATIEAAFKEKCDCLYVAGSLEELAARTGINLNGLQNTVDEYNLACEAGSDPIFNKNPKCMRTIKTPPFYTGRLVPSAYGSLGGIKINYKTEVINKDFEHIPGLYAAGVDANTIYGDSYIYILPGNTLGFALNSGRIAGENAGIYIKSLGN
jgi:fumarate reductase flavoprotein subunit